MTEKIYTYSELETAAKRLVRGTSFRAIMNEVESMREPGNTDSGYLSWDELERYYDRIFGHSPSKMAAIKKFVLEHREPKYPVHIVVRDADNVWYRRTADGWNVFGNSDTVLFATPKRPLRVVGELSRGILRGFI